MSTFRATVQGGRIEVMAPGGLPDGTEVLVEVTPMSAARIGIDESEWRDDAAAIADWDSWIKRIEPMQPSPAGLADADRYEAEFGRHNVEAVRDQMGGGGPA